MSPARKTPSSNPPGSRPLTAYVESEEERSAIRARVRRTARRVSGEHSARPVPAVRTRLDLKIDFANVMLLDLPPVSERARLLRIAVVRRDETLLDELLGIGSPPRLA